MGFSVSSLSQYVNQEQKTLLAAMVAGANSLNTGSVQVLEGIKAGSALQMKFFAQTPTYQTASCPDVSGTTTFTEKNVTTKLFTVYDGVCTDDLTAKLTKYIPLGASSDIEIPNEIVDDLLKQISRDVEKTAWMGGIATGNLLFTGVNGWVYKLVNTYSSSTFTTDSVYTAFTSSNAIAIMDDIMSNVPAAIANLNLRVSLPVSAYNALKVALRNANYYNFEAAGSPDSFILPGYDNVEVMRTNGLAGYEYGVVTVADAGDLVLTADLRSDIETIEVWFDKTDDKMYWRVKFALGTEVAFPEQVGLISW